MPHLQSARQWHGDGPRNSGSLSVFMAWKRADWVGGGVVRDFSRPTGIRGEFDKAPYREAIYTPLPDWAKNGLIWANLIRD